MKIRRALVSVSDKTGLIPLARCLRRWKVEILSTGRTLQALQKARIPARSVSEITGFPEILEGRVKTLHPLIYGGLLYRREKKSHRREVTKHRIPSIDLVVVNLYPFNETIQKKGVKREAALEQIDIGGPALLRAAAKNFDSVVAVTDPRDYGTVVGELEKYQGEVSEETRARLAQKVFEQTSLYDHFIASYLGQKEGHRAGRAAEPPPLPARLDVIYEKALELRYGENPHQRGALYRRLGKPRFDFHCLHGKELSFNNLLDIEATVEGLREFADRVAACVIKHANPCGIAEGGTLDEAAQKAVEGDALSAFGGIVGLTRSCDAATAKKIYELLHFLEVIVAPQFLPEALGFLKSRKNVRLVEVGDLSKSGPWDLRFSKFGVLVQDRDSPIRSRERELRKKLRVVTRLSPNKEDLEELWFAWKCVKVVRSNAIVISRGRQTVGVGAGQMSRIDSVEIACRKAGTRSRQSYLASDAFFPMPDSIERAGEAGIRAIIQPGGSIRDGDVIEAANRAGLAMVLTGERHFRH